MVSAGFVWTGLGVGWVMGSRGWGLSGLKQDDLYFVIWAVVLPDVLNQTVFTWGWGLAGLAYQEGWRPRWPRVGSLVWAWTVLFFLRTGLVAWSIVI